MVAMGRVVAVLFVVALVASSCGSSPAFVQPPPETAPDDAVASFLSAGGLPAVAVAVVDAGEVLYQKVAGVRLVGNATLVSDDDAFQIGSITKSMTALLAGTVVDSGQLAWDATVGDVLAGTITVGAPYRAVTLSQLLNQESGLPAALLPADWASFDDISPPVAAERRRMATLALALPSQSAPGTAFLYSNFNFVVAGLMLEVATGKSWETLMAERLFVPLAMAHAGFGPPSTPGTVDAPSGHNPLPPMPGVYPDNPPALGPSGTVHANLGDMLRYVQLYFDGGLGPNGRIVSEEALAKMETPQLGEYGFGWWVRHDDANRVVLIHNGGNTYFYGIVVIFPAQRRAIIVMTNMGGLTRGVARAGQLLDYLEAHYGFPPQAPVIP